MKKMDNTSRSMHSQNILEPGEKNRNKIITLYNICDFSAIYVPTINECVQTIKTLSLRILDYL